MKTSKPTFTSQITLAKLSQVRRIPSLLQKAGKENHDENIANRSLRAKPRFEKPAFTGLSKPCFRIDSVKKRKPCPQQQFLRRSEPGIRPDDEQSPVWTLVWHKTMSTSQQQTLHKNQTIRPYFNWLSQESGPMGKARNLALATSIAAVQEGKTFFCPKFFIMNLPQGIF